MCFIIFKRACNIFTLTFIALSATFINHSTILKLISQHQLKLKILNKTLLGLHTLRNGLQSKMDQ